MIERGKIVVENLSKKFQMGFKGQGSLSYIISCISGVEPKREIVALKNVSLSVKTGENLGIIGKNGSGKTTLIATIAGILNPDEGKIKIGGNMIFLSGMTNGLRARLSVRDNIYLVGAIIGLARKDIEEKFDEIIEFSGLNDFIDAKVYQLSSGMKARLAFSITMHCLAHSSPDILLLDEVFSGGGGDEEFKNKGLKKMEEFTKGGTTVVLVSHNMETVERYCDRVIWLDKGEIIKEGDPKNVISAYLEFVKKSKISNGR